MTLKAKLIGMTTGMALFFAAVNYVQFGRVLANQKNAAVLRLESQTALLANSIAAQFYERYVSTQTLALYDALRREKLSEDEITSLFNTHAKMHGSYDLLLLVDAKGNYVASNRRGGNGRQLNLNQLRAWNYANTTWFRSAFAGQTSDDASRGLTGTYVEDAQLDPISTAAFGENRLGTSFSVPVKNLHGEVSAILSIRTNFSWVENEFKAFYTLLRNQGLGSAELSLINKSGYTLLEYDPTANRGNLEVHHDFNNTLLKQNLSLMGTNYLPVSDLMAGKSGAAMVTNPLKKVEQATGYYSLKGANRFLDGLGWGAIIAINESDAFAFINHCRNQFMIITAVLLGIFGLITYFFAVSVAQGLAKVSHYISDTSSQVMAGSEQMASASQSLASTATEAASSLEETVSSIEQLTAMVKRNAEHAMEAANLSRASRQSADDGEVEIKNLVSAMNGINQSSKKIEDIINVIDDISFQTNLLALNAAVEAARAGEQGKGFAVVAEEVRNLAQRSAAAAKDITSLIKENVTMIEAGVDIAGQGGLALRNIVTSVRKVADLNSEIASASREQSHGLIQISEAMAQLDQVTQTNAASAEEVASSAEEMSSQGLMMQETVSRLNALIHGAKSTTLLAQAAPNTPPGFLSSTPATPNVIPMRSRSANAEKVIPFESDSNDKGKLGNTSGF
jgi:hypothetical protein